MAGRSTQRQAREVRPRLGEVGVASFIELSRPTAGREFVIEVEGVGGVRIRLTLRDGGRFHLAGLEGEERHA
jgi:hypothetical protein